MRKNMKRGLAAGALALGMGFPIAAFAAPGDGYDGDCAAPEEVRAVMQSEEIQAFREKHLAEAAQLREERRATQDPDTRDAYLQEMTQLREEYRAQIEEQLTLQGEEEALQWFQDHSGAAGAQAGQGGNRAGLGDGTGTGMMQQRRAAVEG